ncbi:MAG: hypothetical protein AB7N76_27840 [Planctomycetota bacterium]
MSAWPPELPEEAFTRRVVSWLAARFPGSSFEFQDPLGLRIEHPDGSQRDARLDNLWRSYRVDAAGFPTVIEHYARAVEETLDPASRAPGLEDVVPLVRSLSWVREVHAALASHSADPKDEPVASPLVADLCIVLAFDREHGIQVLRREDMQELDREAGALLTRGLENLARRLPEPELRALQGVTMVSAGGNYESSLLLFDGLWMQLAGDLEGDLLAAAPTRDLVLFSDDARLGAREELRSVADALFAESSHPVSPALLRFTPRGWVAVDDPGEDEEES